MFSSVLLANCVSLFCAGIILLVGMSLLPGFVLILMFPLLVIFSASDIGVLAWVLKIKWIQWLGERSYSIYLWHASLIILFHNSFMKRQFGELASCLLVVFSVLVLSELSYRFFENPLRIWIRNISNLKKARLSNEGFRSGRPSS